MRFEKIKLRNIWPFMGEHELDLTQINGQLIAFTGENGQGKSTMLGMFAGAVHREIPGPKKFYPISDFARCRDSFVEATVCNGSRYSVRQSIDAISGKGETSIVGEDGLPRIETGKVKDGDRWLADHFPSRELLYSSSFSAQGRRGFLDMKESERKALIMELLGLARFERLAERAREAARSAKSDLDAMRARLLEVDEPDHEALATAVTFAASRVDKTAQAARDARKALERARAAAGDAARAAELAEQRAGVETRLRAARELVASIETKIANNRALLARDAEVRAAVARAESLATSLEAAKADETAKAGELKIADAATMAASVARSRAADDVRRACDRLAKAANRLRDRDAVMAAGEQVARLQCAVSEFDTQISGAESLAFDLEHAVLNGKEERIGSLRAGLEHVARGTDQTASIRTAYEALATDDASCAFAFSAPVELAAARSKIDALRRGLAAARAELSTAEKLAARAGEMEQAEADQRQADADASAATQSFESATTVMDAAVARSNELKAAMDTARNLTVSLAAERASLTPLLALLPDLDKATVRIEEREASLVPARVAVAQAESELAALPFLTAEPVNLDAFTREAETAEMNEASARGLYAVAQGDVARAAEATKKRADLTAKITELETHLADWTRLAQDLGRDGIQAMEIDAALPELNALSNELLHTCHGSQFTVELKTDRLSADGKRTIEDLQVRVLDTVNGREADADAHSGGECVIAGEAVSLALTVLSCRRNGIERPTLVRDESAAALDPRNARTYVAMLRMAANMIGADRILMVTHSKEVQEMADARVVFAGGRFEVTT